jgi:mannosyltransferase
MSGLGVSPALPARHRKTEIAALTLAAAVAGLLFLSRESFGLDEAFSIELASSPWETFWKKLAYSELNGGPYFVLLRPWLELGESEFAVRSLSVLAGVAAIPPFYALAGRLFDSSAARIGTLLLVANSFFVYYQQDARGYSLALLLLVLATYAWVRWLETASGFWTVAYAATAALSVYAHFFSLYVIAAHAATLPLRRRDLPPRSSLVRIYGLLAILLVPLGLYFATGYTGQLWWVREPTLHDLVEALMRLSGGAEPKAFPLSDWIVLLAYAAACALALPAARREWRRGRGRADGWPFALVLAWLLFPLLGSFVVSFWKPMFVERYLLVALPALALLAGAGLAWIGQRRIRLAAATALVALSAVQLGAQYADETKEDYRAALAYLAAHAREGDAVVIYRPYVRVPFEHYLERHPGLAARVTPLYPTFPWGGVDLAVDQNQPPDIAELARAEDRYGRIWLVLAHNRINETGARTTEGLSSVLSSDRTSSTRTFPGLSITLESPRESTSQSWVAAKPVE